MQAKTFAILSSVAILLFVIELIRQQKMTFRYSITWLVTALFALALAIFDPLLFKLSALAGFELPSNFIFFLFFLFFIFLSLLLTLYINEQNNHTETLAQSLAILQYKIDQLQKESLDKPMPRRDS